MKTTSLKTRHKQCRTGKALIPQTQPNPTQPGVLSYMPQARFWWHYQSRPRSFTHSSLIYFLGKALPVSIRVLSSVCPTVAPRFAAPLVVSPSILSKVVVSPLVSLPVPAASDSVCPPLAILSSWRRFGSAGSRSAPLMSATLPARFPSACSMEKPTPLSEGVLV
jgi:hypothetical protein